LTAFGLGLIPERKGASATGALYVIRTGYGSVVSGNNVSFYGNSASSVYGFYISSGTVCGIPLQYGISATGPVFGFKLNTMPL
jgi:hypothetical protein